MPNAPKRSSHVILASHANLKYKETLPIVWGAKSALERGPVVASITNSKTTGSHTLTLRVN